MDKHMFRFLPSSKYNKVAKETEGQGSLRYSIIDKKGHGIQTI